MFTNTPGWKLILALLGVLIIGASLFYVDNLTNRLEKEEYRKMRAWVEANKEILTADDEDNLNLATEILASNTTIPIIQVDKQGRILNTNNIDEKESPEKNRRYTEKKLIQFRAEHEPIVLRYNPEDSTDYHLIYFGDSYILKEIKYYPYIQLGIISLFIVVILISLNLSNKSTQNLVWAGLAKETAHQLGTPLSSLEAWTELLKENAENESIATEMGRDLERLKMISERFSKIGSTPELEEQELIGHIHHVVVYMKHRAPKLIRFRVNTNGKEEIYGKISPLLFDWVLENLLKNALDAMSGKGTITINIDDYPDEIIIDVEDTGKGMTSKQVSKVFNPGFSTKKRGWGLGLSLGKRIMESYHHGKLFVKESEAGEGTTFRIVLKK